MNIVADLLVVEVLNKFNYETLNELMNSGCLKRGEEREESHLLGMFNDLNI